MTGRFRRVDEIPQDRAAVVGANIRVLRQQHGWNQAQLGVSIQALPVSDLR